MSIPLTESQYAAWESFQASGTCDETVIAPPILRSWQRCAALGLDPRRVCGPGKEQPLALDEAQTALVALARPYMEDLYQFVEGSGFAVLLADATLTMIEIIGDVDMLEAIRSTGLSRGSSWREDLIGSMALNLALREALPWQTRGAEHFCACYHQFACSAAPLFYVGGQAMGVIGVLGRSAEAHSHTLGMVIAATQAIQAQVRNNMLLAETNDHLAELNAAIEAMSEGLIFLDAQGRISKINSRAGQMLGLAPRSVAGRVLEDLLELPRTLASALERRREISEQELLFPGRKGAFAALCSVRPVWDRSRRYLGALITLRPSASIQRLVQRVVGAEARFSFADIIGESTAIQAALRHARVAANSVAPVLLIGEPGAGKELFAHAIHNAGARSNEPFVVLNCAAVPRTLLMGELLGYEGGQAGRSEGRPGKLELAHGGTLLLEDVGALTVEAQTSLLRVIETQHLIRSGGQRVVAVDTRIIASSAGDLDRAVSEGRFRAELFYRLSVLTIHIPPLRARGDDVLLLLDQILSTMNRRLGRQVLFAPEALSALRAYPWPGNVRELEATLERVLHMNEKSVLALADLPPAIGQSLASASAAPLPTARLYDRHAAAERETILRAGREAGGHLGRAAERLGISRATLWRKMKLYGLTKEHFWAASSAGSALAGP
ncbi:MAG TPA: sigma 54-interacting transcriptional regulator [Roseiflexaceae bacterium]|nr:sigma 54-interacting transcriptional regulator [Roseiflexaceae bacterium]